MTVIENKLLRRERTQAVSQQDVWLAGAVFLRNDTKRDHVLDELIKAAWSEVAKAIGRFCSQAVSAVVVSVDYKLVVNQNFS